MSLSAAAIRLLAEKGLSALDIAEVAEAMAPARDPVAERRRAYDRQRKREEREEERLSAGMSTGLPPDTAPPSSPPFSSPEPLSKTPPLSPRTTIRGARLSDDFTAPAEWIDWAMAKRGWGRAEAVDESECFARYWQAKAGKDAVKRDWFKTFQNWVSNSRRPNAQAPPEYVGAPC